MNKAQDYSAIMKDMFGAFAFDATAMEKAFKSTVALNEKLSGVAINAAEKSAEISGQWTKETLSKLSEVSKVKNDPSDYVKAATDFASAQAETTAERAAAYAEIVKKFQLDTVEIMMSAGKDISEDATAAVQKAANDASAAVQKATKEASNVARKATAAAAK